MMLQEKIQALRSNIPNILNKVAKVIERDVIAVAQSNMELRPKSDPKNASFVGGSKLGIRSKDGLNASWVAKVNGNNIEIANTKVYARIQEFGGFIASKGKMDKFFLAMYYKTKNPFYRIMFLSVKKNKGVKLKPRPFLEPTIKDLQEGDFRERIQSTLFLELAKVWNG